MDASVKRWVSYGGLVFVVIVIVAVFAGASPPSTNATAAKVASFYHKHQAGQYFTAYMIMAAVIVGLAYFWYLREYLIQAPANRRLLTIAYGAAIVFAGSGVLGAGVKFAVADASHAGNISATSMQTLNVLQNDLNVPMTAAGTAAFLLVIGIAVVRNGVLPRWLGWVGIVFGVLSATGIPGPIGIGLWILLASITVIVTNRRADAPVLATASQ